MRRLEKLFDGVDVAFVSVRACYADNVAPSKYYEVADVTRFNIAMLAVLIPQLLRILLRERPKVVLTSGALPGLIAIVLAKLFVGSRTIWIESIAACETLSTSGKHARRFADHWLTQWPHLATKQGPQYLGSVL